MIQLNLDLLLEFGKVEIETSNVVCPTSPIYESEEYKELEKTCLAMEQEDLKGEAVKKPLEAPPFETCCYFI